MKKYRCVLVKRYELSGLQQLLDSETEAGWELVTSISWLNGFVLVFKDQIGPAS